MINLTKVHLSFLLVVILSCQKTQPDSSVPCDLIDIGNVGYTCDSLRSMGMHGQAAQLYFSTGEQNQSSELFVYAAWQFNESGNTDSSLISVQRAIEYGMNDPYALTKIGIENLELSSDLSKEVEQQLKVIQQKNGSLDNFEIVTSPMNNFWSYYDQAIQDTIKGRAYLSAFICNGSYAFS